MTYEEMERALVPLRRKMDFEAMYQLLNTTLESETGVARGRTLAIYAETMMRQSVYLAPQALNMMRRAYRSVRSHKVWRVVWAIGGLRMALICGETAMAERCAAILRAGLQQKRLPPALQPWAGRCYLALARYEQILGNLTQTVDMGRRAIDACDRYPGPYDTADERCYRLMSRMITADALVALARVDEAQRYLAEMCALPAHAKMQAYIPYLEAAIAEKEGDLPALDRALSAYEANTEALYDPELRFSAVALRARYHIARAEFAACERCMERLIDEAIAAGNMRMLIRCQRFLAEQRAVREEGGERSDATIWEVSPE